MEPLHQALEVHFKKEDVCCQCWSPALLTCLETSSLLVLVEWFHQKDYPLCAEVGASGSIICQQFIGGATPPGSRGAPSKRRMYAGSVGLQLC